MVEQMIVVSNNVMRTIVMSYLVARMILMKSSLRILVAGMSVDLRRATNVATAGERRAATYATHSINTPTASCIPKVQRMLAAPVSPVAHVVLKCNGYFFTLVTGQFYAASNLAGHRALIATLPE